MRFDEQGKLIDGVMLALHMKQGISASVSEHITQA